MLSYQLNSSCLSCGSIDDILVNLDKKLDKLSRIHYAQITNLSSTSLDKRKLQDVIFYKQILMQLQFNQESFIFDSKEILSKAKTLAA